MPEHASGPICNGRFTIVAGAVLGEEVWFAAPWASSGPFHPGVRPGYGGRISLTMVLKGLTQSYRTDHRFFLEQLKSDGFHRHLPKEAASK